MTKAIYIAAAALMLAGCSRKTTGDSAVTPQPETVPGVVLGSSPRTMPKASLFRMTGDYARNVAVTLNADGSLAYYPAPGDITSVSAPVEVGDGWWLNRQGLGPNSVFTDWTFEQYRALKATPPQSEIKAHIIPGARVSEFKQLPITASEARENPAICCKYID